jgi:glycosyltransferase involved in cell wall biosynthesis
MVMAKPRVLYVVHGLPPESTGGTELHTSWLANELSSKFEIFILARTSDPSLEEYETRDENHRMLKVRRIKVSNKYWINPSDEYLNSRVNDIFGRYINEVDPALVHIQHAVGLSATIIETAKSRGIPVILQLRDFFYMCERWHLLDADNNLCDGPLDGSICANCIKSDSMAYVPKRFVNLYSPVFEQAGRDRAEYMRKVLLLPDMILAQSSYVKEKFVEFGLPTRKIRILPSGIKIRSIPRRRHAQEKMVFAFFGTTVYQKGLEILIEAFGMLDQRRAELRIYGSKGETPDLTKYRISSNNLKFLGPYSNEELPKILSNIDVVVHPSICHESSPLVIKEAFSAGIPVIVSNIRAQSDAVTDGKNGLHFRAGDPDALAEKMNLLLERPDLLNKFARNIPKVRTIEDQARELTTVYSKFIGTKKRRPIEQRLCEELREIRERIVSRDLDQVIRPRITSTEDEMIKLHSDLVELAAIRGSFSYHVSRFFTTRIDRLFPDGTQRGNLRKIVTKSLQVIMERTRGSEQ